MEITEVRVFPVEEDRLKAYATVTFEDCFVVRDLKVINGNTGLFVAMPSKKRKDGSFKDIAHPLNNEFRSVLEKTVLEAYSSADLADEEEGEEEEQVDSQTESQAESQTDSGEAASEENGSESQEGLAENA